MTAPSKSWFSMSKEERWSPACLDMVASAWSLDVKDDIPKLLQLRERLSAEFEGYHLLDPLELARCYHDAKGKLPQAEEQFRKMVAWRKEEGIDDLLQQAAAVPQYVHTYYPSCFLDGVDKDGDPIWCDRVGASDVLMVHQHYGHVPFRDYTLYVRENGLRGAFAREFERRHGRPPARVTCILDMEGLCRRHLHVELISPLEEGIQFLQEYYGGMAKHIFVVRAPFVFRIVWSIAQHFCSESLKKTIVLCNARNTQSTLEKYMDRDVLPPTLGGRGKPGVGFEKSGNLQGGVMPEEALHEPDPLQLKSSGSSDTTVASNDTYSMDGSTTPPVSPASSMLSTGVGGVCDSIPEAASVTYSQSVNVRTTLLLSGYLTDDDGDNRRVMIK
ncbi:SEC14-like protein 2 [Seminavis robusta]|uniref:SEC14-like protein 2 n=1 Tax=Seminavis robusta TaxID=568900 RepID=A0A9N8DRQ1_9STRA|nr:SEC14-like protein 2 [Seminavis robusta]|eukprot:Sro234_g094500.1 SEC14-like protein 2 (387) ;mRNA; f:58757-59917